MVLLGLSGHMYWKPKKASVKTWTILKLSSKWHSVALDFLLNHLCGPSRWWIVLTGGNHGSTKGPRVPRPATSNPLPVCPLRYIGAGPQFRLEGGNEGSQFPCAAFSNMWDRWLPDLQWRPVQWGLCGNEEFEKAVAEILHDTYRDGACPLWIEILIQEERGWNNAVHSAARASSS